MKYEELGKGFIKKRDRKTIGLFIDGTGLDRATRRINRKVDMAALVRGVTSGIAPTIARYYTLIPYEDDSRQRAFLDAVARAGLSVIVKRLPPKGVNRQVSVDLEMAADMVAFALGLTSFSKENEYLPADLLAAVQGYTSADPLPRRGAPLQLTRSQENRATAEKDGEAPLITEANPSQRKVVVVCPSRELSYPIGLIKDLGADTTNADFGQFNSGDILKSASKWIDLSDSETIWRD
jgi:hypothetical protein